MRQQAPVAFAPNTNADPGNVNAPVIFEAPFNLSRSGNHEIWIAVSGSSPNWGGCHVWVALDNTATTYKQIGTVTARARMGVLGGGGTFGATGDPYTGPVGQTFDLTQSNGVLNSGTQADADSYRTLMYFGGEFISYSSLTSGRHQYLLPRQSQAADPHTFVADCWAAPLPRMRRVSRWFGWMMPSLPGHMIRHSSARQSP